MAGFFLSIALYEQILANFRNYPERGTVLPETKLVDARQFWFGGFFLAIALYEQILANFRNYPERGTVLPETKLVDAP
ncbi:MAG: hypothetical protein EAZ25_30215 [Oscillatoriales cyanobacterium]|nr:MAG: hypothetical protein EAZ25_30215 [Oscillatoriales cyanobacterium]